MASVSDEIAVLRGTRPATFRNLLRDPAFSRLYRAILVSSLGDWVGFVAVVALVTRIGGAEGAGYAVSGVMLARLLPSLLFGPFAGVLVDRFDRKKLMFISDVVRGVGYATLPLIPHLPWIFGVSFLIECLSLLWTPARDAIIPNLVPRRQLGNANTIALATGYGTLPLGGIVYTALATLSAGVLGSRFGYFAENPESVALWIDALSFAFSAYMISGLPLRAAARRGKGGRLGASGALADMREGIRFLKDHTFVRAMTVGVILAFTGAGAVMSVGPIFAAQTLEGGPASWGVLVTAVGVGLGVGMALAGQIHKWIEKDTFFPLALLAGAAALVVLALTPNILLASLVVVVVGAAAGSTWVTGYTLLQENVGDELRGRVFATLTVLSRLGLFVSLAGFPLLAQLLPTFSVFGATIQGTRQAIVSGAVIMVAGGVFSRRGLARSRLTRPRPLRLMPRLRKTEKRGTFITFEGVEGAGKGTQIRLAREFLEGLGYEVLVTREPGGTSLGERLRNSLLEREGEGVDARAEALLFAASRAQHVSRVIRPALEEGKVVLCDRYMDSSLAYQGAARGLGEQDVLSLNVWATQGLFADLVILLNLDPDKRRDRLQDDPDRIEREDDAFHNKVAEAFMRIAEDHPERFMVIDADAPPNVVHERVKHELLRYLKAEEDAS